VHLLLRIGLPAIVFFVACDQAAAVEIPPSVARLCEGENLIPGFTEPKVVQRVRSVYPKEEDRNWSEGWVGLVVTIKADGSISEVAVEEALGAEALIKRAMKEVKGWRYEPATLNGKPVETYGTYLLYVYAFPGKDRVTVHSSVVKKFRNAQDLMQERKFAEAVTVLEKAFDRPATHYEQAMVSSLMAEAYLQLKNRRQALIKVRHATFEDGKYINDEMIRPALRMRVVLAAQEGDFLDSLCTYSRLKLIGLTGEKETDTSPADQVEKVVKIVTDALNNPTPLTMPAEIFPDPSGVASWNRSVLRRKFAFEAITGTVDRFRLVCMTVQMEEKIDPAMEWSIPPEAGYCRIFVYGTPGSTFKFVEMN
jgi:TonB family protein